MGKNKVFMEVLKPFGVFNTSNYYFYFYVILMLLFFSDPFIFHYLHSICIATFI